VVTVDIPSAAANTFANSQYDTNAIPNWPNAALDHQRVDVVTPLLEMHGPIRFTSSHPPELCLLSCDKEPANLRRRYCSGSNVVMLRPSCPNSTRRCEALMSAWGQRVDLAAYRSLPLYPHKQTSVPCVGMSQMCQFRTHAPHKNRSMFDHRVGAGARRFIRASPLSEAPRSTASRLIARPAR
jgi:hypothetical protein